MIVDPDFFDHWKTLTLVDSLDGDPAAPLYVLRLWAHCQNRRQWKFRNLSEAALKSLCRYSGDAQRLIAAMSSSGFVVASGDGEITVSGWDEYNAKLIANWQNGIRGGRPRKPTDNPTETQPKPNCAIPETQMRSFGNPTETQTCNLETQIRNQETQAGKTETDRIGLDGIGLDRTFTHTHTQRREAPKEFSVEWNRWCEFRLAIDGRELDPIRADLDLMELGRRGPEKAKRDIDFSIRKNAKSILDSDNDFERRNRSSPPAGQGRPRTKSVSELLGEGGE